MACSGDLMNRHRCECSICTERGEEIESARVEIERLTAAKRRFSKEADERAQEANELRIEIERLRLAVLRIDAINDNPAHFISGINAVCDEILRPDLNKPSRKRMAP